MPKKVEIPEWEEFKAYAFERIKKYDDDPELYTDYISDKYDAWKEAGWNKEIKGKLVPIINWKTTLIQCMAHRVRNKVIKEISKVKPLRYDNKLMDIDNETLISAWKHYKENKILDPSHLECFNILYKRGVFKNGNEKMKNGKLWQVWYDSLAVKSLPFAIGHAIDTKLPQDERNKVRNGKHELVITYIKLFAVQYYFSKYQTSTQLRMAL